MNKIAKQLMLIARDYKFAETKEEIKNILGSVQIRIADGFWNEFEQKNEEYAENIQNAETPQQAKDWFEEMKENLQKAVDIQQNIAEIRDDMAKQVSNWNTALKQIFKIFKGEKGFPNVITALSKNPYFKKIGDELEKSFERVGDKCKEYNFDKMDEKTFIELAGDNNNKLYENFIQPFVDMYNGYMDKFEELQKVYQKLIAENEKKLKEQEEIVENFVDEQGNTNKTDDKAPQWDFSQKQKFSKKLYKIASELENILG